MSPYVYSITGLVVLLLASFSVWRLASRREILPCPTWLGWLVELDNPLFPDNSARAIIQRLDLQPGMKVLDFGCGPGRLTIPLAQQLGPQGEVTALDIQPGMLQRTQNKAQAAKLDNIRYLQVGSGGDRLASSEYDRVLLVTVLGEIPDRKKALQEIFDALKFGGMLSITEVVADPHFQRRSTIRELVRALGFKETGCYGNRLAFTMNLEKPVRAHS